MKLLSKLLLGIILLLGSAYAQYDITHIKRQTKKDYTVLIKSENFLPVGIRNIDVRITHKPHRIRNAHVVLKVYTPDDKIIKYKTKQVNDKGTYTINVNLNKEGKYKYILSFKRGGGGVTHTYKGGFTI